MHGFDLFTQSDLLPRLTSALRKRNREVIFLVGSPLSAPVAPNTLGVPNVDGMLQIIRNEFADDPDQQAELDDLIHSFEQRRYQEAFRFLQSRRGASVANELVRTAVLSACTESERYRAQSGDEQACQLLEADDSQWTLSPATIALAKLAAGHPETFGKAILTTNFDPLIEIAISRIGGRHYKTIMQGDGNISITSAPGCQIIHLHGYWYGSNTFHTTRQLTQARPQLKASLARLLRGRLVVVNGYGGWDDIFTSTLLEMVEDDNDETEILWTTFATSPQFRPDVEARMTGAADKGRIFIYSGIDSNVFLPELERWWDENVLSTVAAIPMVLSPVNFAPTVIQSMELPVQGEQILEGDNEDRPPIIEFCLGRDKELEQLEFSTSKVIFITGIGGQGKSTIAAKAFGDRQRKFPDDTYIWRDCKEESERFENQLASIVESLTLGRVRGRDLVKQDIKTIVDILVPLLKDRSCLFVFDNIDHYIDLETERLNENIELFVNAVTDKTEGTRVFFTSRPSVDPPNSKSSAIHLKGLSLGAAKALFNERGDRSNEADVNEAYKLTDGHAFWLDLLAIQAAKNEPNTSLRQQVEQIHAGKGDLPTKMLQSTWAKLRDRERIVLRSMAEAVRPERENEIAEYVKSDLPFRKVFKALKSLRRANLVVVKRLRAGDEVLELHPLVRSFIRQQFSQTERLSFIDGIIKVYQRFLGIHRSQLTERPTFLVLQNWTQAAELSLAAGRTANAFTIMSEAVGAFSSSAFPREFTRVARILLATGDFVKEHKNYPHFDHVFQAHVSLLSYLGEFNEVDSLLSKFSLTVPGRDSRFIFYCHMRCYAYWVKRDFSQAVEWGKRGYDLKIESAVDSNEGIEHIQALALRDGGNPDEALETFLAGRTLEAVTDADEFEEERGGAYYGNIGRCLHFMGDLEGALTCYQKSAIIIEKDRVHEHTLNQGFVRLWVGEVFIGKKNMKIGLEFLEAARRKWEQVNPLEALRIAGLQEQIEGFSDILRERSNRVESRFRDWIVGKLG
jgi:tetratricopeptide (TPR) repeat protein